MTWTGRTVFSGRNRWDLRCFVAVGNTAGRAVVRSSVDGRRRRAFRGPGELTLVLPQGLRSLLRRLKRVCGGSLVLTVRR